MPILFSSVACGTRIFAKHACCEGNFLEIVNEVLSKVPSCNHKITYSHGRYLFHYIVADSYCYFCITDKTCQRSRAFLFLNEVKRRFSRKDKRFEKVLAEEMTRYSDDCSTITVRKGELDEVNYIGVQSSEIILGEKILLVRNPEEIAFKTVSYINGTTQQAVNSYESMAAQSSRFSKITCMTYLLILTVIFVFIWLILSSVGPTKLLVIACAIIIFIKRLKKDNKGTSF